MANRKISLFAATLAVALSLPATAGADPVARQALDERRVSEGAMLMDALIARPLLLAGTVAGTGLFLVSAPFTLAGGTTGETWETLVVTPASATFARCLGCTPAQNDQVEARRRTARLQEEGVN